MGPLNISLCAAYLIEATFVIDRAKFFAGTLSAMSAMIMLELPHVNILSKMDLVSNMVAKKELGRFVDPDSTLIDEDETIGNNAEPNTDAAQKSSVPSENSYKSLNRAVARLIDEFSMVQFLKLDAQDEDSIGTILAYIDEAIQYHEAQEPREPAEIDAQDPAWEEG